MTSLALIRHGHTAWNRAGRIQGRTDIPIDAEAEAQLSQLALPPPWDQAKLVASPLQRAMRTGELIAGRTPRPIPALTEMDWGDWEGQQGKQLLADPNAGYKHIEEWGWHYRPPNGESPEDVYNRLLPWVTALTEDTVAVCHIGIMRVLMARATGWAFDGEAPFRIKRNRLFVLTISDGNLTAVGEPIRLPEKSS